MSDARRHRFHLDRRDARRARPSSEARSVVLRRRIRRHSGAPAAHRRRRISGRRRDDPVRCLVVAGTAAAAVAAGAKCTRTSRLACRSRRSEFSRTALFCMREISIGVMQGTSAGTSAAQDREMLADRLSTELRRSFLYLKQYWEEDVSQVLLCGDMPEIRSLTAPLIERLNIEVETLDTLEGIDAASASRRLCRTRLVASSRLVDCGRAAARQSAARRSDGEPNTSGRASAAVDRSAVAIGAHEARESALTREGVLPREASSLRPQHAMSRAVTRRDFRDQ